MNTQLKIYIILFLVPWGRLSAQEKISAVRVPGDTLKRVQSSSLMNATAAETYMQIIDYSWHIRGGLLGLNLNGSKSPVPNGSEKDLFSYKLEYETAGQWSGNIGKQSWNHVNGTTPVGIRNYTFTYDGLSRLKTAAYSGLSGESYGIPNINYDRNGNITQLQRNGKMGGSSGLMDNLTYTYSGNRLTAVNDAVSGSYEVDFVKRGSGTYSYYANGALKSDENEEITNIVYNTYLNLPEEITLTGGRWIRYTYDGEGKLLKTEYSTGEYWEYVDEFVFKNGQPYQVAIADGRARYESGNWVKEFDYQDHLGNTRVSFKESSTGAELTARTDFDPWGVRLNGTGTVNAFQNRWELQGKEKESTFNLNRVDFGARVYNPTIGRWDRTDLLSEKYYSFSTYNYVLNNPINLFDPDGNSPEDPPTGKVIAVFYHGGPTGGGKTTTARNAGGTGNIYNSTKSYATASGRDFSGRIIAPGLTSSSGVKNGLGFIKDSYKEGDQVIVYGYSYGTDVAVDLSTQLKEMNIPVDLLITVDGSDGPLQNSTVNTSIPQNVRTNLNVFQTNDSGTSSSSRSTGVSSSNSSSGSSSSNSGTLNFPGSNGGPNKAVNRSTTNVINKNITGVGVNHGNIQQKAEGLILPAIKKKIQD